jgi:hypothetical protein
VILKRAEPARFAPLRALLRRKWLLRIGALAVFAAMLGSATLWGLYQGMHLYRLKKAASLADLLDDVVAMRLAVVPNWIAGWWGSDAERIVLDVKHTDFQKIAYQRELAMRRGVLIASADDYVPGKIRHGERTIRVKLRLKGDWADHVTGDKWSFRVKVRRDDTLFGMKVFSLHHPQTRRFVNEWVFHQALAREDLLGLRYEFVEVTVNGKDLGVYALEEHFDKRLVEHRRRREGPILKFDESLHWDDIVRTGRRGPYSATGLRDFRAATVDGFRSGSLREDPQQWDAFLMGASLLEGFRAGDLSTSQVFDTSRLGTFFALVDLLGAEHAASWINLRFYYDPIASRLEPVGFDANAGAPLRTVLGSAEALDAGAPDFAALAFADPVLVREYVAALERMADPAYLDALFAAIEPELERNLRILHKEFPWVRFAADVLRENQRTIRSVLAPGRQLHAYLDRSGPGRVDLELANLAPLPVEIVRLISGDAVWLPQAASVLASTPPSRPLAWVALPFASRGDVGPAQEPEGPLELEYRLLGSQQLRRQYVFDRPRRLPDLEATDLARSAPNFREFGFLEVDETARVVRIRPGSWTLDRDLVLPAGYRVLCGAGTPHVVIGSSDGTGQGVAVLNAGGTSHLEHVTIRGLRSPARPGWTLTGAVTFYESPVVVSHSEFEGNEAEDGLNVVRSHFEIDQTTFRDSRSDTFDADFSDGVIRRSLFLGSGNDAIDVSGSRVTVSSVRVERAGDKGVSAGERAELVLEDVEVRGAAIGVASKDDSRVVADGLRVGEVGVALALYRKKSEFGPASMELRDVHIEDATTRHLVEEGSTLVVAGISVDSNARAVYAQLYGTESG